MKQTRAVYKCLHGGCPQFGKIVERIEKRRPHKGKAFSFGAAPRTFSTVVLEYCSTCHYVLSFVRRAA